MASKKDSPAEREDWEEEGQAARAVRRREQDRLLDLKREKEKSLLEQVRILLPQLEHFEDSILAIKEMAPIEQDKPAMAETLERLRKGRAITKERIRIITIASVHGWHVVGLYLQDKLVGDDKAFAAAVERAKRESTASSSSKNRSSRRDKSEPSSSSSSFYKKSSWKDRDTPWSYPNAFPMPFGFFGGGRGNFGNFGGGGNGGGYHSDWQPGRGSRESRHHGSPPRSRDRSRSPYHRSSSSSSNERPCYRCQGFGHIARNCPTAK